MEPQITCSQCSANISLSSYYCPNCGKKLKEKPVPTSILAQVLIYALSFFLPPLGLWPAIKYLRQPDQKSKQIGWVALIITVATTVATIYISIIIFNSVSGNLTDQIKMYQNLNF